MHALITSSAATYQLSGAYSIHEQTTRSRQALEAVDAYLQLDDIASAPPTATFRLLPFLNDLVAKLLE